MDVTSLPLRNASARTSSLMLISSTGHMTPNGPSASYSTMPITRPIAPLTSDTMLIWPKRRATLGEADTMAAMPHSGASKSAKGGKTIAIIQFTGAICDAGRASSSPLPRAGENGIFTHQQVLRGHAEVERQVAHKQQRHEQAELRKADR
jgi:hypothetical protein